jgi:hypothetical protein
MARNGGAKKIAVNGVYLISVLRLEHFDLISDVLPFGRLWYGEPDAVSYAIGYAKFRSRSHDVVIRVYDAGVPNPGQHVQCRMAYTWPFFTSSSS